MDAASFSYQPMLPGDWDNPDLIVIDGEFWVRVAVEPSTGALVSLNGESEESSLKPGIVQGWMRSRPFVLRLGENIFGNLLSNGITIYVAFAIAVDKGFLSATTPGFWVAVTLAWLVGAAVVGCIMFKVASLKRFEKHGEVLAWLSLPLLWVVVTTAAYFIARRMGLDFSRVFTR